MHCFTFASSFSMQHSSCSAYIRHTMISHLFTACIIVKKKKKSIKCFRDNLYTWNAATYFLRTARHHPDSSWALVAGEKKLKCNWHKIPWKYRKLFREKILTQLWMLQQWECQQLNGYDREGISLDRRETRSLTPISAQSQISLSRKAGNTTKPSNSQAIVTTQPFV